MIKANARGVSGPTEKFEPMTVERRDLDSRDVLIEIKYAGICHSDIHCAHSE